MLPPGMRVLPGPSRQGPEALPLFVVLWRLRQRLRIVYEPDIHTRPVQPAEVVSL